MRIIVRQCLPWGNYSTQSIEAEPEQDIQALMDRIAERFGMKQTKQILKFKRDGVCLKLVPGWTLAFYNLKEKSIVYLEDVDNQINEEDPTQQVAKMKGGYFAKLGILSKVEEENEEEETRDKRVSKVDFSSFLSGGGSNSDGTLSPHKLSNGSEVDYGKIEEKRKQQKFREDVEKAIKAVKTNEIDKLKEILQKLSDIQEERAIESIRLINESGKSGWNALHFAVFLGHQEIVKELLSLGADPNLVSQDGWTPLQLAIHRNNIEIFKLVLKHPKIDVSQNTSKSTALHIAVRNNKLDVTQMLLEKGCDIMQNIFPFKPNQNDKIRELIETESLKRKDISVFKPPRPPIVRGYIYKRSEYLFKMNERYFVLNPLQGSLIRFMKKEDYPHKPKEIIPLKDISGIRRMNAGTFYGKDFHYIQLLYNKRYILACRNVDIANKWVTYIIQGIVYANYAEDRIREELSRTGSIAVKDFILESGEEIELEDPKRQEGDSENKKKEWYKNEQPQLPRTESILQPEESKQQKKNEDTKQNGERRISRRTDISPQEQEELNSVLDQKINFSSFEVIKVLGSGAFGRVFKAKKKDDGKIYALKALKKRNLILKNQLKYAVTECNVLKAANHPFVLNLNYAFQTPTHLYLALDYCPGGDLSLHLAQRVHFMEEEARFYVAELILAIEHLHSLDVIYRDLKPENILIGSDGHIKLADFGLSKEGVTDSTTATSFCGSPAYLSPEMLRNKGVGKAADIYGIGTVLYELITGSSPYYDDDIPKMYQNIKKAKLFYPPGTSDKAKNLINKLLDRDPNTRLGTKSKEDIKKDPFFEGIDWKKLLNKEITPPKLDPLDDDEPEFPMAGKTLIVDQDYTEKNKTANRVKNFTFVRGSDKTNGH